MYNNPTYKSPAPEDLQTLMDAVTRALALNLNCVRPGVVQSFNAVKQTAVIKIAQQQVTSVSPDGVETIASFPLLLNVPVQFPSGGGFTLTFPIAEGDECILLFNDRQLDTWKQVGAGQPPAIGRTHDLSDALALVGIRNFSRSLAGVSTHSTQLRSDDGQTYVEIAGGGIANVVAPMAINLTAPTININASTAVNVTTPVETITGTLDIQNTGSSSTPCVINGNITTNGDVTASGISLIHHVHGGVTTGGGNTGPAE